MAIQLSGSLQLTGSLFVDGDPVVLANQTSSLNVASASYASTASYADAFTVAGEIVAQTLNVQQVTSSVVYSSGSNVFGNSVSNTQEFTGSLQVTGSIHHILGNLGIDTTTPAYKLTVDGVSGEGSIGIERDTVSANTVIGAFNFTNNNGATVYGRVRGGRNSAGDGYVSLGTGLGDNLYAIEGGNVGIGTTSPTGTYGKLTVNGSISLLDDQNTKLEIGRYSAGAPNSYIKLGANSNSLRITNNTDLADLLYLTNDGNLGLGVTPSAWDGTLNRAIQIADNGASISSHSTGNTSSKFLFLNNNAYYDSGGWKYLASNYAVQYRLANSEHQWYTSPSGTAGNAISFTQAMTLNASGNLSIGNTNDTYKLDVSGTGRFTGNLFVSNSTDCYPEFITAPSDADVFLGFTNTGDGNNAWGVGRRNTGEFWITNFTGNFNSGTRTTVLSLATTGAATFTSSTFSVAKFNSTYGQVNIDFQNNGTGFASIGSGVSVTATAAADDLGLGTGGLNKNIVFATGTGYTERMRISSAGNVGIGTTVPGQTFVVQGEIAKYTTTGYDGTFDNFIKYGYFNDLRTGGTGNTNRWIGFDASITAGGGISNVLRVRAFGGGSNNDAPVNIADFRGDLSTVFYGDVGINNTNPGAKLHISSTNPFRYTGGGITKQHLIDSKTAASSGTSLKLFYVGFSHAVRLYLYILQDTSNVATAIADFTTAYGSSTGGITQSATLGNISSVSAAYNNGGSPAYTIDVTVNYSGAAPTIFATIEGISNDALYKVE